MRQTAAHRRATRASAFRRVLTALLVATYVIVGFGGEISCAKETLATANSLASSELAVASVSFAQEISPPNPTITYVATSKAVSTRRKADARVARLWAAVCLIGLGISNFVAQHYYDSAPESGCNARAFAGKPRRRHWISRYCGRNSSS